MSHGESRQGPPDADRIDAFAQQGFLCLLRWREMPGRHHVGHAPVHLFRPGGTEIAGAQSRFDVSDGHIAIERGERGGQRGGGVAMDQHGIGQEAIQHRVNARKHARRNVGQALALADDVEVEVRRDLEEPQYLVQHLPVLAGDADPQVETARLPEPMNQRCHLDGLRAGPEYSQNFLRHGSLSARKGIPAGALAGDCLRSPGPHVPAGRAPWLCVSQPDRRFVMSRTCTPRRRRAMPVPSSCSPLNSLGILRCRQEQEPTSDAIAVAELLLIPPRPSGYRSQCVANAAPHSTSPPR